MSVEQRPRFQQAVYDDGFKDGRRAGFTDGEAYGRADQRMEDEVKPAIGFLLGVLASEIVVLALHAAGVIRW